MTAPTITDLPEVPPTNDADFETKAPALFNAIKNTFVGEVNDFGDYLNTTDWLTLALGLSANKLTYSNGAGDVVVAPELHWDSTNKRLGIGTSSPTAKLEVDNSTNNTSSFKTSKSGNARHNFYIDGSGNSGSGFYDSSNTLKALINTSGSSFFNGGNVGIGTASPLNTLDIYAPSSNGSSGAGNGLRVIDSSGTFAQSLTLGINQTGLYSFIQSQQSGVGVKYLSINPQGGNVGIGTISPSAKLDVNGPIKCASYTVATVPSASSSGAGATIYVTDETGGAIICFSDGTNWRRVSDRAIIS